jgi:mutator protein MutT
MKSLNATPTIQAAPTAVGARGVVAVIERDGRFLMIQRAEGIVLGGAWCFPGGGIQADETERQAITREVREEVGLIVRPSERLWTWHRGDGRLTLHWWGAVLIGGELQPDPTEVQATAWLAPDEIRGQDGILPGNLDFLSFYRPNRDSA